MSSVLEPQQLATIMTHMIGHNLGLKHDEDGKCHMIRFVQVLAIMDYYFLFNFVRNQVIVNSCYSPLCMDLVQFKFLEEISYFQ